MGLLLYFFWFVELGCFDIMNHDLPMWLPFKTLSGFLAEVHSTAQGYFGNFELHGGVKQLLGHGSGFWGFMQIDVAAYGMQAMSCEGVSSCALQFCRERGEVSTGHCTVRIGARARTAIAS